MFVKLFIVDFSDSKSTLAAALILTGVGERPYRTDTLSFWGVNALQNFSLLVFVFPDLRGLSEVRVLKKLIPGLAYPRVFMTNSL